MMEPPRGVRRKRRESPGSLEQPQQSSQLAVTTETTIKTHRKKRVKRASISSQEQLGQELDRAATQEPEEDEEVLDETDNITLGGIPQHRSKHVRFSDPSLAAADLPPPGKMIQTPNASRRSFSPQVTPHPAAAERRRSSLPPVVTESPDGSIIEQIQFSPLREVLDERVRRRLRRSHLSEEVNAIDEHKKEDAQTRQELKQLRQQIADKNARMQEIMYELETQRQMSIDAFNDEEDPKVKSLEEQVRLLQSEIADHKLEGGLDHEDTDAITGADLSDAEDDMILIDPEDLNISQEEMRPAPLPVMISSEVDVDASQMSHNDPAHEDQIRAFERAVAQLSREASDAKAELQILSIELKNLGFADATASPEAVLTAIRGVFHQARADYDEVVPAANPNQYENGRFVNVIVQKLRNFKEKLIESNKAIERYRELEAILRSQHKGLINKLADLESQKTKIETQWQELDVANEEKSKQIVELEDELNGLQDDLEARDATIAERDATVVEIKEENTGHESTIERLQIALEGYRDEIKGLEGIITRLDAEYKQGYAEQERNHAKTVVDLEDRLNAQSTRIEMAEQDADTKTAEISRLEIRIEEDETELEDLREQLGNAQQEAAAEAADRRELETENEQKAGFIEELETKIENVENEVENLTGQLADLKARLDSERRQREQAETELDTSNNHITELDEQLRHTGKQANELRQKLYEAQIDKERAVAALKEEAATREDQYNEDIAAEVALREAADTEIAEKTINVEALTEKLRVLDETTKALLLAKDNLLASQEAAIGDMTQQLADADQMHEDYRAEKEEEIRSLHADVAILANTLAAKNELLEQMQNEAVDTAREHGETVEDLEGQILALTADLKAARADVAQLVREKGSLENRVNKEAEELLVAQTTYGDEIDSLNASVNERDKHIGKLLEKVREQDETYRSLSDSKALEIEELQQLELEKTVQISDLSQQVLALKEKCRELGVNGKAAVAAVTKQFADALAKAQEAQEMYVDKTEEIMMDADTVDLPSAASELEPVAVSKKKTRVTRQSRKRNYDSAIGSTDGQEDGEGDVVVDEEMREVGSVRRKGPVGRLVNGMT